MRGVEQIPWVYDAMMAVLESSGLKRWRAWLVGGARGRTLEVGCGTGRNLPLYDPARPPVAIEPAPDTLAKARRRNPGALLVRARAEALPFRAGAFDTVVSGLVFCSVPRPEVGLAEVRRVLAPGGQLRMIEHVRPNRRFSGWVCDAVQPTWTWIAGGCHPNRRTEAAVEAAGFTILDEGRRSDGTLRRFVALPQASATEERLDAE